MVGARGDVEALRLRRHHHRRRRGCCHRCCCHRCCSCCLGCLLFISIGTCPRTTSPSRLVLPLGLKCGAELLTSSIAMTVDAPPTPPTHLPTLQNNKLIKELVELRKQG